MFSIDHDICRIYIVSDNITMIAPEMGAETCQRITIHADGRVRISRYIYDGEKLRAPSPRRPQVIKIAPDVAAKIMTAAGDILNCREDDWTDCGEWDVSLTNAASQTIGRSGSLYVNREPDSPIITFSNLIRESLGQKDLFVLDGSSEN